MGQVIKNKCNGYIVFDHDGTLVDTRHHPYELFTGMKDFLAELKSLGFTLVVWTARPRKSTLEITKRLDISQFFDEFYCFDDGLPKPNIAGLSTLCDGIDKNKILHIGDSLSDIDGAKAFGVEVVAACWGDLNMLDKFQPLANYTARNLEECRSIIKGKFHV
jgi:phosphoglycolate phosphatase-like HAD superfamily hydrolase